MRRLFEYCSNQRIIRDRGNRSHIPDERIFDVVEKVIDIYAENGQGRERLGNYIDRIGLDEFKKLLNIEEFLKA